MSRGTVRHSWLPWLALAVIVAVLVVWVAWPSGSDSDADRVRAISSRIRCPDCESLSAADSQTATARAIRRDIAQRVADGESDATIEQAYVDRYGESILLEPERSGFGLLVWGLPVLFLAAGAVGLFVAFRRWRGVERMRATDDDEALVREQRAGSGPHDE